MLWTDSIFITTADLMRIDAEVQSVADTEQIVLTGSNGLLRAGVEESATELSKIIIAFGGYLNSGDLSANHYAAVLNVGIGNSVRQKALLNQICVSGTVPGEWNWVKEWAIFGTLKSFYRNAFGRTVTDRYKAKMDFYEKEIQRRLSKHFNGLGIPIVLRPLSAPAAFYERNSGSWDSSNVSLTAGPGTSTASVDVAITYVDMSSGNLYISPVAPNNAESAAPTPVTVQLTSGHLVSVDIGTLNPPTGAQSPETILVCVISPLKATHWNVYVGPAGGTLFLQNVSPIPIATTSYTLAGDPTTGRYSLGMGQFPNRRLSVVPTRQRA